MKYLALDIETTGLDMENDQILEFGAVAVDTKKPPHTWESIHLIINHPRITGNVYALSMHNRIFEFIKNRKKENIYYGETYPKMCAVIDPKDLYHFLMNFIRKNDFDISKRGGYTITAAGKNASNFDIPFLKKHFNKFNNTKFSELNDDPNNREQLNFRKRVIDPAILYTDFIEDEMVADLSLCKQRAGLDHIVTHNALEDTWDVVLLICESMGWELDQMITEEFVNSNWIEGQFQNTTKKTWLLNNNNGTSGALFYHPEIKNPFAKWELRLGTDDSIFIWHRKELDKYIPIKGEA